VVIIDSQILKSSAQQAPLFPKAKNVNVIIDNTSKRIESAVANLFFFIGNYLLLFLPWAGPPLPFIIAMENAYRVDEVSDRNGYNIGLSMYLDDLG
jgi:hypothetical protein